MTKPLSLGFIGGGINSEVGQVHFVASRMDNRWQLDAGAFSRDTASNTKSGEQWGVPENRRYRSWIDLIASEKANLDAVSVLLPSPQHASAVTQVLEAGIPVICEKPLATSLEEIEAIETALTKHSGFLAVTFNYSAYPMIRFLRDIVNQGQLGEIQQFQFEMPQESFVRPSQNPTKQLPQAWRLNDDTIPMVSLDLGLHLYHLAHFLSGKTPQRINAEYSNFSGRDNVTDDVKIWSRYADGMRGSFWFSKSAIGYRNGMRLRVFGSKGSAEWLQMDPDILTFSYVDGKRSTIDRSCLTAESNAYDRYNRMKAGHPAGFIEAFANLYADIADELTRYKTNPNQNHDFNSGFVYGIGHTKNCIQFFHAASLSNKEQCWIDI